MVGEEQAGVGQRRRPKGTGSLQRLDRGRYRLRVFVGTDPVTGHPRQVARTVQAKNQTEARTMLERLRAKVAAVEPSGSTATVRTLVQEWLAHAVLSAALGQAVRLGWLEQNPAARAQPPELGQVELKVPTPAEVRALLARAQAENDRWGTLVLLAVLTGARRGELCALRWTDIDGSVVRIRRSLYRAGQDRGEKGTKGGRERRVSVGEAGVELLAQWRRICEDRAAAAGVELSADGFVVSPFPDGSRPVNPDSFSSAVHRMCEQLGMAHVHLHSLRHFAATELLAGGIDARNAAEILGHANPSLTLSVYAHATADRQRQAADVLGRVLNPG